MGMQVKKNINVDNVNRLKKIISDLRYKRIKIGIFSTSGSQVMMIAAVHEYGCNITITSKMRWWLRTNGLYVKSTTRQIHIPERSYMRKTFNEKKDKIDNFIKNNLDMLFTFQISSQQFLDKVGEYIAGLVRETLTEVISPTLHPFTIKRKKGKAKPLIDTGKLRESITYQIE